MYPIRFTNSAPLALISEPNTENSTLSGAAKMYLLHEALSKTRMRRPQAGRITTSTEATRSARTVALEGRRRAARDLGTR